MRSLLGRFHRPFARGVDEQLLLLNNLGDGSTLSLDFTTGVLDPRLTFTRSTTGTYINSSGYVTSAAIDAPRFDYKPSSQAALGLLIEGSAVNYMLESSSLNGYSNSSMAAVSAGSETDPTGTANSARQIYAAAGGTYHAYFRSITAGTNTQITVSIWAKARNYTHLFLSDGNTGRAAVRFNLSTGATDNNFGAGYVSAKATQFPNGWWRCEMVVNVTASTAYAWGFVGAPSGATLNAFGAQYTGTGNAADGIYCYGFQVEGGSSASSYIPTGASTGSRALDSCYIAGTNFTSWFSTGAGTVVAQSDNVCTVGQNTLCNFSDSTINNQIRMGDGTGGGANELLLTVVGGSNQGVVDSLFNPALNTAYKTAYAWDTNNFAICANGGAVATDTGGTLAGAGVITSVTIGGDFYQTSGPNSVNMKNGHIRSWKYYPTRLPNAQLQALTT